MKKKKQTGDMGSIIIRDIDESLRKQFRLLCIKADVSMNSYLKELIGRIVQEGKLK